MKEIRSYLPESFYTYKKTRLALCQQFLGIMLCYEILEGCTISDTLRLFIRIDTLSIRIIFPEKEFGKQIFNDLTRGCAR